MYEKYGKKFLYKLKDKKVLLSIALVLSITCTIATSIWVYLESRKYTLGDAETLDIRTNAILEEDRELEYWEYNVDFDYLEGVNSEVVGWIRFDEPEIISYAVLQNPDNFYYLDKGIDKGDNYFGSIYVDASKENAFEEGNAILYGHNMKNGSMFGALDNFKDKNYLSEHPYFYIYTNDNIARKYMIFSVQTVNDDSWHYQQDFKSNSSLSVFIEKILKNNSLTVDVDVELATNMVTLSTCTSNDLQRLIVQGVEVERREMENLN